MEWAGLDMGHMDYIRVFFVGLFTSLCFFGNVFAAEETISGPLRDRSSGLIITGYAVQVPETDPEADTPLADAVESETIVIDGTGGSGYSAAPSKQIEKKIDYLAIAKTAREGCIPAQTRAPITTPTAVVYLDEFFVIAGTPSATWLPPKPTNPNATIHGIDADGDCVRDDIEHYIARQYRQDSQYKLRKYLYEYAAWLDRFLLQGISEETAKTAYRNMAVTGECVSRIVGDTAGPKALDDLFAKFHNTVPRSYRYLENLKQTSGWTTRENISISCP